MAFTDILKERVAKQHKRIVLPESESRRVLKAAQRITSEGFAQIIVIGNRGDIEKQAAPYHIDLHGVEIIDPSSYDRVDEICAYLKRRNQELPEQEEVSLRAVCQDKILFAAGLVAIGAADGMVAGTMTTPAELIHIGLRVFGLGKGESIVSGSIIMVTKQTHFGDNGVLVFGDSGTICYPTAENLVDIAGHCVRRAMATVQIRNPRVAFLSFSTKGSSAGFTVDTVREAVELMKSKDVDFVFDGEIQADAAIVPSVGEQKAPGSPVAGRANILIFPTLDSANIAYKLVRHFSNAIALGPLIQGLAKPIHSVSRGGSSRDITNAVAVCCADAIVLDRKEKGNLNEGLKEVLSHDSIRSFETI